MKFLKIWLSSLSEFKVAIFTISITMFAWSTFDACFPLFIKYIVDLLAHNNNKELSSLIPYLFGFYSIIFISQFFMHFNEYIQAKFFPDAKSKLRRDILNIILNYKYEFFNIYSLGCISSKINDMVNSFEILARAAIYNYFPVVSSILISTLLFWNIYPIFAILLFGWFFGIMAISVVYAKSIIFKSAGHAEQDNLMFNHILDYIVNIRIIKIFSNPDYVNRLIQNRQLDCIKSHKVVNLHIFKVHLIQGFITISMIVLVSIMMVYCWQNSLITIGEVIFILTTLFNASRSLMGTADQVIHTFKDWGVANQAYSMLSTKYKDIDKENQHSSNDTSYLLSLHDINFNFHNRSNVLNNIKLIIRPGDKIGILGESGCGKSTLINLILKLYTPTTGTIDLNFNQINEVNKPHFTDYFSSAFQDPCLFNLSIKENIMFGSEYESGSLERLYNACKDAEAYNFIMELPNQFDSIIGEGYIKLSSGQKQRIAIARALYKKAHLYVFDEATSNIDTLTESRILSNIFKRYKTVIFVTHNLNIISQMQTIILMKSGRITEYGTHKSLLSMSREYSMLWESFVNDLNQEKATVISL